MDELNVIFSKKTYDISQTELYSVCDGMQSRDVSVSSGCARFLDTVKKSPESDTLIRDTLTHLIGIRCKTPALVQIALIYCHKVKFALKHGTIDRCKCLSVSALELALESLKGIELSGPILSAIASAYVCCELSGMGSSLMELLEVINTRQFVTELGNVIADADKIELLPLSIQLIEISSTLCPQMNLGSEELIISSIDGFSEYVEMFSTCCKAGYNCKGGKSVVFIVHRFIESAFKHLDSLVSNFDLLFNLHTDYASLNSSIASVCEVLCDISEYISLDNNFEDYKAVAMSGHDCMMNVWLLCRSRRQLVQKIRSAIALLNANFYDDRDTMTSLVVACLYSNDLEELELRTSEMSEALKIVEPGSWYLLDRPFEATSTTPAELLGESAHYLLTHELNTMTLSSYSGDGFGINNERMKTLYELERMYCYYVSACYRTLIRVAKETPLCLVSGLLSLPNGLGSRDIDDLLLNTPQQSSFAWSQVQYSVASVIGTPTGVDLNMPFRTALMILDVIIPASTLWLPEDFNSSFDVSLQNIGRAWSKSSVVLASVMSCSPSQDTITSENMLDELRELLFSAHLNLKDFLAYSDMGAPTSDPTEYMNWLCIRLQGSVIFPINFISGCLESRCEFLASRAKKRSIIREIMSRLNFVPTASMPILIDVSGSAELPKFLEWRFAESLFFVNRIHASLGFRVSHSLLENEVLVNSVMKHRSAYKAFLEFVITDNYADPHTVLNIIRSSLRLPQSDTYYPFSSKQDHVGCVAIEKLALRYRNCSRPMQDLEDLALDVLNLVRMTRDRGIYTINGITNKRVITCYDSLPLAARGAAIVLFDNSPPLYYQFVKSLFEITCELEDAPSSVVTDYGIAALLKCCRRTLEIAHSNGDLWNEIILFKHHLTSPTVPRPSLKPESIGCTPPPSLYGVYAEFGRIAIPAIVQLVQQTMAHCDGVLSRKEGLRLLEVFIVEPAFCEILCMAAVELNAILLFTDLALLAHKTGNVTNKVEIQKAVSSAAIRLVLESYNHADQSQSVLAKEARMELMMFYTIIPSGNLSDMVVIDGLFSYIINVITGDTMEPPYSAFAYLTGALSRYYQEPHTTDTFLDLFGPHSAILEQKFLSLVGIIQAACALKVNDEDIRQKQLYSVSAKTMNKIISQNSTAARVSDLSFEEWALMLCVYVIAVQRYYDNVSTVQYGNTITAISTMIASVYHSCLPSIKIPLGRISRFLNNMSVLKHSRVYESILPATPISIFKNADASSVFIDDLSAYVKNIELNSERGINSISRCLKRRISLVKLTKKFSRAI